MTADTETQSESQVRNRSGRYKNQVGKSPGRVASGYRLHERNEAGIGGRRPTHGRAALMELLKRGLDDGSPVVALQREVETGYLQDLGGRENTSSMEQGLVRRMAILDLDLALLLAQRDGAARLSRNEASQLRQDITRNTAAYSACVKTVGGPGKRAKDASGPLVVLRDPKPDNGTTQESA